MLANRLGTERVAEDAASARELVRLCGGLPLALRIAAATLLEHPGYPLAAYARELRKGDWLSALETEDTTIRSAFDGSYHRLPEPHRRVFRLLGLHPGTEVTARVVAGLAGIEVSAADRILAALVTAGLAEDHGRARFGLPIVGGDSRS